MRLKRFAIAVMLVLIFSAPRGAHAYDLGLLVGGNWSGSNISVAPGTTLALADSAVVGIAFGAYSHWTLMPGLLTLDADLLYVNNAQSGASNTVNFSSIDIPLILRYPGLPYFKPGLGLKYSAFVGSFNTTNGTASGSAPFSSAVSATQGISTANFSFVLSLGGRYGVGHGYFLVGQLDYDLGLSDLNSPSVTNASNKLNNVMFLLGVSRGF